MFAFKTFIVPHFPPNLPPTVGQEGDDLAQGPGGGGVEELEVQAVLQVLARSWSLQPLEMKWWGQTDSQLPQRQSWRRRSGGGGGYQSELFVDVHSCWLTVEVVMVSMVGSGTGCWW